MSKPNTVHNGQSLVEVALVLPMLLVLFLGIADVGFLLYTHVQVANAVRTGARAGSLCRMHNNCITLPTVVESAVFGEAQFLDMGPTNTTVTTLPVSPGAKPAVGSSITVTVTYTHSPIFLSNFVPMFPPSLSVEHTSVMRISN